jgi:hypothetical protein
MTWYGQIPPQIASYSENHAKTKFKSHSLIMQRKFCFLTRSQHKIQIHFDIHRRWSHLRKNCKILILNILVQKRWRAFFKSLLKWQCIYLCMMVRFSIVNDCLPHQIVMLYSSFLIFFNVFWLDLLFFESFLLIFSDSFWRSLYSEPKPHRIMRLRNTANIEKLCLIQSMLGRNRKLMMKKHCITDIF